MKNPFPKSVIRFWQSEHPFSYSGRNDDIEIHHICKRVSDSIYNSIPLSHHEHSEGNIHRPETEAKYLRWTKGFIDGILATNPDAYTIRENDILFLANNKHLYGESE